MSTAVYARPVIAIHRFLVPESDRQDFPAAAATALGYLRRRQGAQAVDLVANIDDRGLWALVSRWPDVGQYRRAIGGAAATYALMPLTAYVVDEPSAYLPADELGENVPCGQAE